MPEAAVPTRASVPPALVYCNQDIVGATRVSALSIFRSALFILIAVLDILKVAFEFGVISPSPNTLIN